MLAVVWSALGIGRWVAIAALVAGAYWFVWDTGRGFERSRWEAATVVELSRQQAVLEDALLASEVAAGLLLASEDRRLALVRKLTNEALEDSRADNSCIGPVGVLRLNAFSGEADAD